MRVSLTPQDAINLWVIHLNREQFIFQSANRFRVNHHYTFLPSSNVSGIHSPLLYRNQNLFLSPFVQGAEYNKSLAFWLLTSSLFMLFLKKHMLSYYFLLESILFEIKSLIFTCFPFVKTLFKSIFIVSHLCLKQKALLFLLTCGSSPVQLNFIFSTVIVGGRR